MKKVFVLMVILIASSCNRNKPDTGEKIITVSIAPFEYFVKEIAGDDFSVNIMVPPGANPHIYEPYPEQIINLRKSVAYINDGYLGFEMTWLDRFYEMNKSMVRLSLGDKIDLITPGHGHEGELAEGADPHYWVSPKCAAIMALSVKELLCRLNPSETQKYESNYAGLVVKIGELDKKAGSLLSEFSGEVFMIYHPNLAYLASDYSLVEVPVEFEGKEPPPSRLKELIDIARAKNIKTIFVQREYDSRNAKVIANEMGARVVVIDPLSDNWMKATSDIIEALHKSMAESRK
ncbi:MAG: zinc ABC transporter substrate-binding protein [Bacteroidia bacterium]|nr:zinc ABC transporter substrate-binding protein [Bacteroidia bacterium]